MSFPFECGYLWSVTWTSLTVFVPLALWLMVVPVTATEYILEIWICHWRHGYKLITQIGERRGGNQKGNYRAPNPGELSRIENRSIDLGVPWNLREQGPFFLRRSELISLRPLKLWSESGYWVWVIYLVGSCNWITMGTSVQQEKGFGCTRCITWEVGKEIDILGPVGWEG